MRSARVSTATACRFVISGWAASSNELANVRFRAVKSCPSIVTLALPDVPYVVPDPSGFAVPLALSYVMTTSAGPRPRPTNDRYGLGDGTLTSSRYPPGLIRMRYGVTLSTGAASTAACTVAKSARPVAATVTTTGRPTGAAAAVAVAVAAFADVPATAAPV